MPLQFFGRGSAFADRHNSAFFVANNELVILDCPATTFQIVKHMGWDKYDNIYVLITHTHGDHSGGAGMTLQYIYFASSMKKRVTIVAPSKEVKEDMTLLLNRIEGCEPEWYHIITSDELNKDWFLNVIPTKHTKLLEGKCFGYHLYLDGKKIVYTEDPALLDPFIPLLSKESVLYTEASTFKSGVHLFLEDILPTLEYLTKNDVRVYLMHLDDEEKINKLIKGKNIKLAPLYNE